MVAARAVAVTTLVAVVIMATTLMAIVVTAMVVMAKPATGNKCSERGHVSVIIAMRRGRRTVERQQQYRASEHEPKFY